MIGLPRIRRHARLRELLSAYIDGEVSASETLRVEEHLAGCQECQDELASLRSTVGLLRRLPELAVPRSFALSEAPQRRPTPTIVWTARLATSVAAVLLVALLLGDIVGLVGQQRQLEDAASRAAVQAPGGPAPLAAARGIPEAAAPELESAPALAAPPAPAAAPAPAPSPAPAVSEPAQAFAPPAAPSPAAEAAPSVAAAAAPAAPAAAPGPAPASAVPEPAAQAFAPLAAPSPAADVAPALGALAPAATPSPTADAARSLAAAAAAPAAPAPGPAPTPAPSELAQAFAPPAASSPTAAAAPALAAPAPAPAIAAAAAPSDGGVASPRTPAEEPEIATPELRTLTAQPDTAKALPAPVDTPFTREAPAEVVTPAGGAASDADEGREGVAEDDGLTLPLWQVETALGGLFVIFVLATLWIARRSRWPL